jgi:hypothetical protein
LRIALAAPPAALPRQVEYAIEAIKARSPRPRRKAAPRVAV